MVQPPGDASPASLTARQQKVLQAALEVFAAKGFDGASTAEIAQRAGVAEGTLFKRYRSKRELLMAVVSPFFIRFVTPMAVDPVKGILSDDSVPLEAALRAVIVERAQFLESHWSEFRAIAQEAARMPEMRAALVDYLAPEVCKVLEGFFARRIARGEVRDLDTFTLSRALVSLIATYVIANHAFPAGPCGHGLGGPDGLGDLDEQAGVMADILVNGIRAH